MARMLTLKQLLLIAIAATLVACGRQKGTEGAASRVQSSASAPEQRAQAAAPAADAAAPSLGDPAATRDAAAPAASTPSARHDTAMHMEEGEPGPAHQDHDPKHGGMFFMALDNKHHLEGVLDPPGIFRVYLYNDHTVPVSLEELNRAKMTVIWGDQDGAPQIDLKPGSEESLLEARAPAKVQFPVTLTLLVHFPGMPAAAKPELFTFPFSNYTQKPPSKPQARRVP